MRDRYTALAGRTKVDLRGQFPVVPGMTEEEELQMIDGFFTMVLTEDQATLRTWKDAVR